MVATTTAINAYNIYEDFPRYSYKCIKYMMDNNELIWKLLKYNSPDAWEKSEPTITEPFKCGNCGSIMGQESVCQECGWNKWKY